MSIYKHKVNEKQKSYNDADISQMNVFSMTSSGTECHPISINHNRRLLNELVDSYFDEKKGSCDTSSSPCPSLKLKTSEYTYDKRLKYWKDLLKEREELSARISEKTDKIKAEILYNRLTTVDDRDKKTVVRLMDYAERLQPSKLSTRLPSVLKEKYDMKICQPIAELQETLPQSEKTKKFEMEICGLPKITQRELLGKLKQQGFKKPFIWLKSKHLEKRIEDIREDIERVVEYYPDIGHLQIVGESLMKSELDEHNSDIKVVSCEEICQISTDTTVEGSTNQLQPFVKSTVQVVDYALKINDQLMFMANKRSSRNSKTLVNFTCYPFQSEVKKIFTIQNTGRKALTFEWVHRSFYDKNSALLKPHDNEFLFDTVPFRLCGGEMRDILVKFQPRRVNIVKAKWMLKVKPSFFCRKMDGIVMLLCGVCSPPPEYENLLNEIQAEIIEKSNLKMMKKLTTGLSALTPDLHDYENLCPYQRSLNEVELFEQLNVGFKCDRYHDLELVKDLYKRVRKPRDKLWDFNLHTLRDMILSIPQADSRALFFDQLLGILEGMRGQAKDLESRVLENPEKERSCYLYVRGIICSAIDEWEDLSKKLEDSFYKTLLQIVNNELEQYQIANKGNVNELEDEKSEEFKTMLYDKDAKRVYIMEKRLRRLKSFRDTLYLQTYTLVCDCVENIVNIIEATD